MERLREEGGCCIPQLVYNVQLDGGMKETSKRRKAVRINGRITQ